MKLSYQVPDYNSPGSGPEEAADRPTKEVYPTLELRGEAAIKFLKAYPNLKLGQEFNGPVHLCVTGMKQAEQTSGHVSDYDNCVTFDVYSIEDKKSDVSIDDYEDVKNEEEE